MSKKTIKKAEPQICSDLAILDRLATQERFCVLKFNGVEHRVAVRSLKPTETEQVRDVLVRAMPPKVVKEENGEAKWDFEDPAYLAAKRQNELKGRALALYFACPIYRKAIAEHLNATAKSVQDLDEIVGFVQGQLDEPTVAALYAAILGEEPTPQEHADFFSKTA